MRHPFELVFDIDWEDFPCHFLRIFCHSGHLIWGDEQAGVGPGYKAEIVTNTCLRGEFLGL